MKKNSIEKRYQSLINQGAIEDDEAQRVIIRALDNLLEQLDNKTSPLNSAKKLWSFKKETAPPLTQQKGIYLWGPVGRGKTLLMDLFFESLPVLSKRRVHFQEFMADIHERVHQWRQQSKAGTTRYQEPVTPIVEALSQETTVLCFDEFSVTDIADAMILGRLFSGLFKKGMVVVATSNVEPKDLYEDGLNRGLFIPFIAELQSRMQVLSLHARTDFRLEKIGTARVFYTPANLNAKEALDKLFFRLAGHTSGQETRLTVKGHDLIVPHAANGIARFSFSDLCSKALGALDYMVLAQHYHTLFLENIPKMAFEQRNEAKRFILLIDALYNAKVKLIMSADCDVQDLYQAVNGTEAFEFDRTVSRLIEMRGQDYIELPHDPVVRST